MADRSPELTGFPPLVSNSSGCGRALGPPPPPYEAVTTVEDAARVAGQFFASSVLYLDIRSYSKSASGLTVSASRAPRASRGRRPRVAPHDSVRNNVRLVQLTDHRGTVGIFDVLALGGIPQPLRALLVDDRVDIVGFEMLSIARALRWHFGIEIANPIDLRAGSVLANGYVDHDLDDAYTLASQVERHLGLKLHQNHQTVWGEPSLAREHLDDAALSVALLRPLYADVAAEVERAGVGVTWGIENQIIPAVVEMESTGLGTDPLAFDAIARRAREDADAAEARAREALRDPSLNVNSPEGIKSRVRAVYGLTLDGTAKGVLAANFPRAPALRDVALSRAANARAKAARRYCDSRGHDGRIHARFDPMGAPTGRFGCEDPPLHNVPRDAAFRACFVSSPGSVLVTADYSMAQLRIIAEHTRDPEMMRCFCGSPPVDLHARTAAGMLGKSIDQVTREDRHRAKAVNFGISFGQTEYGLVESAWNKYGVVLTIAEARRFIDAFFALYPGVLAWYNRLYAECRHACASRSASGRQRYLPENERRPSKLAASFAQGTEADGMKLALALLHRRLKRLGAHVVHVLHDEVVAEAPTELAQEVQAVVVECMVTGMQRFTPSVPVVVETSIATIWAK